jgi:hypothetical protein
MANRAAELDLLIGFPGTGKTTTLQKFIDVEVNSRKGRALIVTPDPIEWRQYPELDLTKKTCFSDMQSPHRVIYQPGVIERIADEFSGFYDGLLAFDDCRYYTGANVDAALRKIIIRRRQRQHDIFAAGHGFTEIPPVFFTYANNYFLFYTQDNIDRRKEEIGFAFDAIKQAVQDVNAMYSTNPHSCLFVKARQIAAQ